MTAGPELRTCPVTGRAALISPERAARPFRASESAEECPLCPGHEAGTPPEIEAVRPAGSAADAPDWRLRVVPNKYPAVSPDAPDSPEGERVPAWGVHELVIDTARHVSHPADLTPPEMRELVGCYRRRVGALGESPRTRWVSLFKNVGREAGASLDHAHSQLIALPFVPATVMGELAANERHRRRHGGCGYCALLSRPELVAYANEAVAVVCPPAPRFASELWLVPRRHESRFEAIRSGELDGLADALSWQARRLRALTGNAAVNWLLHTAPAKGDPATGGGYHWHFEVLPRTSRTAGFEWATGAALHALAPEAAATELRGGRG